MIKWALIFAVIAVIAGVLGFGGTAGAAAGIAKRLFFLAVIGFLLFIALGVFAGRKISGNSRKAAAPPTGSRRHSTSGRRTPSLADPRR